MVSALVSLSGDMCCVLWQDTFLSQSASLYPGVQMSTGTYNVGGNPAMDQHRIQGGVDIFLVASCYRNRDKPFIVYQKSSAQVLPKGVMIIILYTECTDVNSPNSEGNEEHEPIFHVSMLDTMFSSMFS